MVEKVEKTVMTQRKTPEPSASDGKRYARQGRRRKTCVPTMTSDTRTRPSRRANAAASQCAVSARGIIVLSSEILGEPRRDHDRVHEPDDDHEKRRLEEEVVDPLAVGIEEGDPVRLSHRPHETGND